MKKETKLWQCRNCSGVCKWEQLDTKSHSYGTAIISQKCCPDCGSALVECISMEQVTEVLDDWHGKQIATEVQSQGWFYDDVDDGFVEI